MTSTGFKRWLEKHGCTFEPGKGGHLRVRLGSRFWGAPDAWLAEQIKKDLGLK